MRSKQYFTSIKNNPHEISTDPLFSLEELSENSSFSSEKYLYEK